MAPGENELDALDLEHCIFVQKIYVNSVGHSLWVFCVVTLFITTWDCTGPGPLGAAVACGKAGHLSLLCMPAPPPAVGAVPKPP